MHHFNRIAIVGAGAMGVLLGARLTLAGEEVLLVDASPAVVAAINEGGLTVTGTVEYRVPARACLIDRLEGEFDLVLLLTKQTHNQAAFPLLLHHLAKDGTIVTLQNGCPEPSVMEFFGPERTMGCAVTWAATAIAPGVTNCTAMPVNWHNALGRPDGTVDERVHQVAALLEKMCVTQVTDNLMGIRWSKLLVNSSFSGMSAALGCTFGDILENPRALRCAQYIARECIVAAGACGVSMQPLAEGEYLDRFMYFEGEEDRSGTEWIFRKLFSNTARGRSSMLQDLDRHLPSEVDYINGQVCRFAARAGVEVPFCSGVVEVVHRIEAGELIPCMENLRYFG